MLLGAKEAAQKCNLQIREVKINQAQKFNDLVSIVIDDGKSHKISKRNNKMAKYTF